MPPTLLFKVLKLG